ncbi:HEPN domain-containing protein [Caryophanon latum]|uniref:ApeA N-terminal domain-containing protein n=1 Tax=Caryophanon latum TaxID=33977 RepID=A0A1C0YWJ7_9BACL|nr:HEPN domain-containing protein [Caryophanon latum]OCS91552.1 hypothetical protein A6K76_08545 [Caryophanon latum]
MEGILKYNERAFYFTVKKNVIYLTDTEDYGGYIPLDNFREAIELFVFDTTEFLSGRIFKNNNRIFFRISNLHRISVSQLKAVIAFFVILQPEIKYVDSLSIRSNEVTSIHFDEELCKINYPTATATVNLEIARKERDSFSFDIDSKSIIGEFLYRLKFDWKSNIPAKINSVLQLNFSKTDDWDFLYELMRIYDEFVCFMTNKSNHNEVKIDLFYETREVGELVIPYFSNETNSIFELNKHIIPLKLIKKQISELFQLIAQKKIYIAHIRERYAEYDYLTPAAVVMIVAGFEWQFTFSDYPFEEQRQKIREYQQDILPAIENLIKENTGEKKKYFKSLKSQLKEQITSVTLEKRINYALKENWETLYPFIAHLYSLNKLQVPKYTEISQVISKARNKIAHGNISEPIDKKIGLDILILEWLYFTMVLDKIGLPSAEIKKVINTLYNRKIALKD